MPGGVGSRRQFALHCGPDQDVGVDHQSIDGVDAGVEVVLDLVEVPVIRIGDPGRDVPLGDPIHVLGCHVQRADDGVQRLVDPGHDLAEVPLVPGGVGSRGQLALHGSTDQGVGIGDQGVDGVDAGVEVVLDFVEVPVIGVGDPGGDIPLGDPVHVLGRHIQRADDRIETVVDTNDDRLVLALMFPGVGPDGQLAFDCRLSEHLGIEYQRIDVVDGIVQVELDLVEIAVVGIGDLGGDVSLADPVYILCGHVQGADDGIQRFVDACYDLLEIPLMFGGIGAGGQLAFDGGLGQHVGVGDQGVDVVDAVVEVELDLVEVALVGIGDLGGDVPFTDPVHVLGGHVQRADDRIQGLVDPDHRLFEIPLMLGDVGPGRQFPRHGGLGQHSGIGHQ